METDIKFTPKKNIIGNTFGCWIVLKFSHRKILANKNKHGYKQSVYFYVAKCANCGIELLKNHNDFREIKSNNFNCRNCHGKEKGFTGLGRLYDNYKRASARRGFDFELSLTEFKIITSDNCCYCGVAPKQVAVIRPKKGYIKHTTWSDYCYNGVDRKDNNLGYKKDNCIACCIICNRAKNNMTFEEFKEYLERVCLHVKRHGLSF